MHKMGRMEQWTDRCTGVRIGRHQVVSDVIDPDGGEQRERFAESMRASTLERW
jgi:hypothetical protein